MFGLKERPEQRDALVLEVPQGILDLVERGLDGLAVDPRDLAQQREVVAEPSGQALERLEVLGEAEATVPEAGVEEGPSDARIAAHHVDDRRHVGAGALAHPGERVGEGDLEREEGVAGVLGQLGRRHVGLDEAATVADQTARTDVASSRSLAATGLPRGSGRDAERPRRPDPLGGTRGSTPPRSRRRDRDARTSGPARVAPRSRPGRWTSRRRPRTRQRGRDAAGGSLEGDEARLAGGARQASRRRRRSPLHLFTASAASTSNRRRPALIICSMRVSRPGSKNGQIPCRSAPIFSSSSSTPTTSWPTAARVAAVIRPT